MATAKDCHVLISYFIKAYEDKHGRKPTVNRHTARWAFDSMLYDLTMVEIRDLIDFYMKTGGSHNNNLPWFANNYDKLVVSKRERDEDVEAIERLKAETKRRTEEWRKKVAANRTGDSGRETD